jgi:hypothetical protein
MQYDAHNLLIRPVSDPEDPGLMTLQGKALILSGLHERGVELLKRLDAKSGSQDPLSLIFQALCILTQTQDRAGGEPLISHTLKLLDFIEQAVDAARDTPWRRWRSR